MEQGHFDLGLGRFGWLRRFGAFGGILMFTGPNSNIGRSIGQWDDNAQAQSI
jgi:hypothetical protein